MKRAALRGLIWIVVGAGVMGVSLAIDRPIEIRWTGVPLGPVVIGVGALLLAWDLWRARRDGDRPE